MINDFGKELEKHEHSCNLNDIPSDDELLDLSELFKVFGDSARVKILFALFQSEFCVAHLAQISGLSPSATSHQLRILKSAGLVKFRREGKQLFYSLNDVHVYSILKAGLEHISE